MSLFIVLLEIAFDDLHTDVVTLSKVIRCLSDRISLLPDTALIFHKMSFGGVCYSLTAISIFSARSFHPSLEKVAAVISVFEKSPSSRIFYCQISSQAQSPSKFTHKCSFEISTPSMPQAFSFSNSVGWVSKVNLNHIRLNSLRRFRINVW